MSMIEELSHTYARPTPRARAKGILPPAKLRQLDEAGLAVVDRDPSEALRDWLDEHVTGNPEDLEWMTAGILRVLGLEDRA